MNEFGKSVKRETNKNMDKTSQNKQEQQSKGTKTTRTFENATESENRS